MAGIPKRKKARERKKAMLPRTRIPRPLLRDGKTT